MRTLRTSCLACCPAAPGAKKAPSKGSDERAARWDGGGLGRLSTRALPRLGGILFWLRALSLRFARNRVEASGRGFLLVRAVDSLGSREMVRGREGVISTLDLLLLTEMGKALGQLLSGSRTQVVALVVVMDSWLLCVPPAAAGIAG